MLVNCALKIREDHPRFDDCKPALIDVLDVIQLVRGEDDAAMSDSSTDSSGARAGNRNGCAISVRGREDRRDLIDAFRNHDPIRVSIADKTRVRQVILQVVGFN